MSPTTKRMPQQSTAAASADMNTHTPQPALAVLIDATSVMPEMVDRLPEVIAPFGRVLLSRVYADWSTGDLDAWAPCIARHAMQPVQQFVCIDEGFVSDGTIIIDAMDLLHSGRYSGFCIVSTHDGLARLAIRLREQGARVYGIGVEHTPRAFAAACDSYVHLCTPVDDSASETGSDTGWQTDQSLPVETAPWKESPGSQQPSPDDVGSCDRQGKASLPQSVLDLIETAVEATADGQGLADLSQVGTYLARVAPWFDPRRYGYRKLADFAEACSNLEVTRSGDVVQHITVRLVHSSWT